MAQVDRRVVQSGSGLGTTTTIVSITDGSDDLTATEVAQIVAYFEQERGANGAGDSAFTVVGISGDIDGGTQVVHLALQGTGSYTPADADLGLAGVTVATVCVFDSENANDL